jgi:hypothetical protein
VTADSEKIYPGFSPLFDASPQSILQRLLLYQEFLVGCGLKPSNVVVLFALRPSPQPSPSGRGSPTVTITSKLQLFAEYVSAIFKIR